MNISTPDSDTLAVHEHALKVVTSMICCVQPYTVAVPWAVASPSIERVAAYILYFMNLLSV